MEAGLGRPSAESPREDPRARLFAASVTLIVTGKGPFFAYFRATEEKKFPVPEMGPFPPPFSAGVSTAAGGERDRAPERSLRGAGMPFTGSGTGGR